MEASAGPGFFVYLIESPSDVDFYDGRSEGTLITAGLGLSGVPSILRTVISPEALEAALKIGLAEAMESFPGQVPVLHLSAHGTKDGLVLSNGESITWSRLRELLFPVSQSLNGCLLLCMSTCEGYFACHMAMWPINEPAPYLALVGTAGTPEWSEAAIAYSAFYHRLSKGAPFGECIAAMKAASGHDGWGFEFAKTSRQVFIDYVKSLVDPSEAPQQLKTKAEEECASGNESELRGG